MRGWTSRRRLGATAALAVAAVTAASCTDSSGTGSDDRAAAGSAAAGGAGSLKGICPDPVVFQTDGWPRAQYGGLYRMIGARPTIDAGKNKVTGALVDDRTDTGVRIEIRAGGPANDYTPSTSLLYTDDSITFGGADLDSAARLSGTDRPVLAVFAPLDLSPVVLMWDPAQHPDFNTIADIGTTGTPVVYDRGATYMAYLVGTGLLRASQVSATYAGSPDRWTAGKGGIVQQGYVTDEVISYQKDKRVWGRKVAYQLVADSGYPVYPQMLTIRPDRKDELRPCLERLVPVLQRSTAGYAADPGRTDRFISELVGRFPKAVGYTEKQGDAAAKAMEDNAILGNGNNTTVGDFEDGRVKRVISIVAPIFAAQQAPVKAGLAPGDLVTNEFIDPGIGVT